MTKVKTKMKYTPQIVIPKEVVSLRQKGKEWSGTHTFAQVVKKTGVSSIQTLFSIMSCARPYKSKGCDDFCLELFYVLEDYLKAEAEVDAAGNIIVFVGEKPTILWSCHTDTIHPQHSGYSPLVYDNIFVCSKDKRQLGADDGVGIWIMLSMINAKIPGLYIFHAGEECGGIGSSYIADHNKALLTGIDQAIAFDRKGTHSVITHQAGGKCCSNLFAKDLCNALNMGHSPDDTGVFTDTANYIYDIPECTNVSAGYYGEHTFNEFLNFKYAVALRDNLIAAHKNGALGTMRVGKDVEAKPAPYRYDYSNNGYYDDGYGQDFQFANYARYGTGYDNKADSDRYDDLVDLVCSDPDTAAAILMDLGITEEYFKKYWK